MAYDASNINENDQQVAGSAPLSQGGGTSPAAQGQEQGASQGPSAPATIQAGQSSTQAAQSQQPKQSNKPASSGMFTNIQNYVQKNQPAAQKMAGAVSQNVGNQASEIRQVAEQKKAQTDAALKANQDAMAKQKEEAAGIIHQQTGISVGGYQPPTQTQDQTNSPTQTPNIEEQATRFQQLSQGPQGVTQVGDLNLSQQNLKSQALQQLAQGANTEQGRQNLLKQTFQGQAPAGYTRGLSGLDQLVVSGDQAAREQMITGTQQQATQLQSDIQNIGSEANKAKMANDLAISKFGADISGLGEEAQKQVMDQVNAEVLNQQQSWANELDNLKMQAASGFGEAMRYGSSEDLAKAIMGDMRVDWNKEGDVEAFSNWSLGRALGLDNRTLDQLSKQRKQNYGADFVDGNINLSDADRARLENNLYVSQQQQNLMNKKITDLIQNASDYGIDTSSYVKQLEGLGKSGTTQDYLKWGGRKGGDQGNKMYEYDVNKFKELTGSIFQDMEKAKESAFQNLVQNKYGEDFQKASGGNIEDLISGKFIDAAGVASEEQANKMSALQKLMGQQTNVIDPTIGSGVGQDSAFFQKLKSDLAKYKPEVKTGGGN